MTPDLRLYLVADPHHVKGDVVQAAEAALLSGVTIVQLRAKCLTDREHLRLARRLVTACGSAGVPLIVNDRLDIALAAGAQGVHLGVDDLPIEDARRLAGPAFAIGFSPETDAQILAARDAGATYLGIGPVFGTATKADAGEALGIEEFHRRCTLSPVPVVGIGGIAVSNAAQVMHAGASGIAVVSAVLGSANPDSAAQQLRAQVDTSVR